MNIGIHSEVYERIWFKFDMIETTELYTLILVGVTLTFIHRQVRQQEKKKKKKRKVYILVVTG